MNNIILFYYQSNNGYSKSEVISFSFTIDFLADGFSYIYSVNNSGYTFFNFYSIKVTVGLSADA